MKESLFTYQITADDYLTHQLFSASMNPFIKKQRKRGLILWTIAFFTLAVVFYIQGNKFLSLYFIIFSIGFVFMYPLYARWIYKRYFKRYINKNFKESNLDSMTLRITEGEITLFNGEEEGKIYVSEIEKIDEIPTHIFIKIQGGRNIIIPKLKLANKEELLDICTYISQKNQVTYDKQLNWKWR